MVKRIEYAFLNHYNQFISNKLVAYKQTHERGCLGLLSESLHIDQARLSNFLKGTIDVTPTYIYAFIKGGFVTVDELLRGKDLSKMSVSERTFWEDAKSLEDRELMNICQNDPQLINIIKDIKRRGKDPKPVLLAAFPSDES